MNPALLAMMLGRSGLLTQAIRTPWREAVLSYLKKPHPKLDPYVLPALKGIDTLDRTMMGPLDYAQRYASKYGKYLSPPPQTTPGASGPF